MQKILTYTLLYFIPAALIAYGIWQNLLALIIGLGWIGSSFVIFEISKDKD
ncbi:hypothetical protein AciM339_0149 [Aciduliprofundum sp. MAR08-339]|uniref:hypothetical protein n=1 Tax=Aciduliprofundum sp. (strain MAR08-339) TaxID=673860 RepID=UPI0002A4C281|nr:hypothetical protein AciM339_0149 [Aciduliprofundum sp. MAR08-339]